MKLFADDRQLTVDYTYSYTCLRASSDPTKIPLHLQPPTNDLTPPLNKHSTELTYPVPHSDTPRSSWSQCRTCFRNAVSIFFIGDQMCLATAKRFPTRLARVDDDFPDL
jgi:hypothetical protein